MANVAAYAAQLQLNWLFTTAAATRPIAWGVGLSLSAPTSVAGSEIGTGSGWSRQTLGMSNASSPAGSTVNATAMTFGSGLTAAVFSGLQVWDTVAATIGNMLGYGTLATPRSLGVGDYLVFPIGSLTVTLG